MQVADRSRGRNTAVGGARGYCEGYGYFDQEQRSVAVFVRLFCWCLLSLAGGYRPVDGPAARLLRQQANAAPSAGALGLPAILFIILKIEQSV